MTEFNPPIPKRTNQELLTIVGAPDDWNKAAVEQAQNELKLRNISQDQVEHAEYLSKRSDRYERFKRAKESYSITDFIFSPFLAIIEILVSWELKKDGYLKKARQQKRFRIFLGIVIIAIFIYSKWPK